jgi:hypothetical protein
MLPFDAEVLYANMGQYNLAIWPMPVVGLLLGLGAFALALRPVPGGGRAVALAVAAFWAWIAAAYHFGHFATINFAAPVYGIAFFAEAALLCWSGALRGGVSFASRMRGRGWAGLALFVLAGLGQPLADLLAGHHWPDIALFGTAPDPTVLGTVAILLMAERPARHLAVIPALWALAAGTTAWELEMWHGLAAPLAILAGAALLAVRPRQ